MSITSKQAAPGLGEKSLAVRTKLINRTTKSGEMARRGHPSLAMEVVQTVDMPHQLYIDKAEGPYLTDLDGNQYIDLTCGFGPNVVGNKFEPVEKALASQIKKGWHYGIPGAEQAQLAELIKESSSAVDEVMFCNSGSEATMFAFRAARAVSGKRVIALFDGSYHGIHDYALVKADHRSDRSEPSSVTLGAGIPEEISKDLMMMLPNRDENAYELIRKHKDNLANTGYALIQNSDGKTVIGSTNPQPLEFRNSGNLLGTFRNGKFGIGVSIPGSYLTVSGIYGSIITFFSSITGRGISGSIISFFSSITGSAISSLIPGYSSRSKNIKFEDSKKSIVVNTPNKTKIDFITKLYFRNELYILIS